MDSKAEQYYPTYTFKPENRDVVLLGFEEAQKIANGQTKVYGQVTNILLAWGYMEIHQNQSRLLIEEYLGDEDDLA